MAEQPEVIAPGPPAPTHRQVLVAMSGLLLGVLLAALDQTIVATALPTIVGELGGLTHLSWVVTAYLLTSSVSMPLYGKVGDLYGRKPIFLFAIGVFLLGSALSGLAQGMGQLIAFRAVQGLGAGGLMVLAQALIADLVGPRERGRYIGWFGAVFGLASVAGPLVGGFFTDNLSWRWVFYVNLPLGALALAVTVLVLNVPRQRREQSIDYRGAVLLGAAVTGIVLLTSWGGTEYAWGSAVIIGLGVASAALLLAFAVSARAAREPIIPLRLFRDRTFTIAATVSAMIGFALFGAVSFLPLFLQVVSGASATNSGLLLLPMMAGIIVAAVVSGQRITRTGRYRHYPIIGTALATVAMLLLSTMGEDTSRLTSGAYMVLLGVGIGLVMQIMVLVTQNTAPPADMGTATSTVSFTRTIGGSLGVALFGAVFANRLGDELAARLPATAAAQIPPPSSITPDLLGRLPDALRQILEVSFATSLASVFRFAIPFLAVAFLAVLLLQELPLRTATTRQLDDTPVPEATSGS